jgi:UDPglucose 6-dehydrogenase
MIQKSSNLRVDFDLSNINADYDKSLVNFIEEPFLNVSEYNIIAITTEWDEFKDYDWENIYKKTIKPTYIFDGRNILEIEKIKKIGFNYIGLGRK